MRMNNQEEGETEKLTNQDFVLQREQQTWKERERWRAESCVETKRGTDGVIGHQQVRDRCNG